MAVGQKAGQVIRSYADRKVGGSIPGCSSLQAKDINPSIIDSNRFYLSIYVCVY